LLQGVIALTALTGLQKICGRVGWKTGDWHHFPQLPRCYAWLSKPLENGCLSPVFLIRNSTSRKLGTGSPFPSLRSHIRDDQLAWEIGASPQFPLTADAAGYPLTPICGFSLEFELRCGDNCVCVYYAAAHSVKGL